MFVLKTDSVNKGYSELINELVNSGTETNPRGMSTLEISPACWEITNPRKRSCEMIGRWKNLGFQLSECLWILGGLNDLKMLQHYVPYYNLFSDDGHTLSGAYGNRLRHWENNGLCVDQFQQVYEKLLSDKDSRQAVMIIFNPALDYKKTKDVPCTNWFHFSIRNNKLNLTVVMRSNDAIWGTPYNMFNFMTIQEVMAGWLGIDVGEYRHIVDCIHFYREKIDVVKRMNSQLKKSIDIYDFCRPQDARLPKLDFEIMLNNILSLEFHSRQGNHYHEIEALRKVDLLPEGYWKNYGRALICDNIIRRAQPWRAMEVLEKIDNEFKYSLMQKIARIMYRTNCDPAKDEKMGRLLKNIPRSFRLWVLENPIKEKEILEESYAKI